MHLKDAVAFQTPMFADRHRLLKSDALLSAVCLCACQVHDANATDWEVLGLSLAIQRFLAISARLCQPDFIRLRTIYR